MMREVATIIPEAWDGRGLNLSNLSMMLESLDGLAEARLVGFRSGIGSREDRVASGVAAWPIGGLAAWRIGRRPGRVGSRDSGRI
jgi:hypothetical protein